MKELMAADDLILLRFDRGDEVVGDLTAWFSKSRFRSALIVSGIGMVRDAQIGAYTPEGYVQSVVEGSSELLALSGNISTRENSPFAHIHVVLGKHDLSTLGGHLFSAGVAVTVEMSLIPTGAVELERRENPGIPGFWEIDVRGV